MPIDWDPRQAGRTVRRSARGGGGGGGFSFNPSSSRRDDDKDDRGRPLGVSENYRVSKLRTSAGMGARAAEGNELQGTGIGSMYQARPRYYADDIGKPANNSPAAIGEAQKMLAAAGLLTGSWRWGVWDPKTQAAWRNVLEYANMRGVTDKAALIEMASGPPGGGRGGGGEGGGGGQGGEWVYDPETGQTTFVEDQFVPPPLELQMPNRKDVETAFRTGIIEKLGVGWSQAEIARMTDLFMGEVRRPQEAAYRSQVENLEDEFYGRAPRNEVVTNVDVMSPETFVEEEARRRDPAGVQATDIAEDFAPAFFQALGKIGA